MDKQRNRDNRRKKQKIQAKRHYRPTPPTTLDESSQSRKIPLAPKSSSEEDDDDVYGMFDYVSQKLVQPESRYADNPVEDLNATNDFEDLVNAVVSSSYFQFKSEKNWTEDISKYSELLAIDVKHLVAVSNCIPFNQFVEVDDKYFTKDQLTYFNGKAEQSKKLYQAELLEKKKLLKIKEQDCSEDVGSNKKVSTVIESNEKQDDDLDFLLSLKEPEPMKVNPVNATFSSPKVNEEPKVSNNATNTKSIDLEKWLDSVLDL